MRQNAAADHDDPAVRDALRTVFGAEGFDGRFGGRFRIQPHTAPTGVALLLVRVWNGARWVTMMAFTEAGDVYLATGKTYTTADFTAVGWNPP